MRQIKRIFIHCTATPQTCTIKQLNDIFKAKGWKYPGYHLVVMPDGKVELLLPDDKVSNGVKGYNLTSINIAYIGGIDAKGKGIDNRTPEQKDALKGLVSEYRAKYPKAEVLGHRDISPDTNGNGIVDPWERIKECPCFNAMEEYK